MNYQKLSQGNYNLHVIQTDRFKTVQVIVNYKNELKKEEITIRNFLNDMLLSTCKEYPTSRALSIATEDLYNISVNGANIRSGKYSILSFKCRFLNEKYTEQGMNEKSISFFMNLLYHPNVVGGSFDETSFGIVKKGLEEDIRSTKDNPRRYSLLRLYEVMAPHSKLSYHPSGYLDDLEKITRQNLYNYYQNMMNNAIVDVFVIGDMNLEDAKTYIEKYLVPPMNRTATGEHILSYSKFREKEQVIKETMDITQSQLMVGCKVEELTPFERQYVMNIYSFILGGGGDSKLFQTVREKNSLCYSISSSYNYLYHTLVISAGIDAKTFKKTFNLIKEQVESMGRGEFEEEMMEKAVATFINGCKEVEDSPTLLSNIYLVHEYMDNDLLEEKLENIKKVTKEMVVELAKKVHIDTVYLLEGGNHEKDSL